MVGKCVRHGRVPASAGDPHRKLGQVSFPVKDCDTFQLLLPNMDGATRPVLTTLPEL